MPAALRTAPHRGIRPAAPAAGVAAPAAAAVAALLAALAVMHPPASAAAALPVDRAAGAVVTAPPLPVYATRPPAAARLDYELRRGALVGSALLRWQPAGARYELELTGRALGIELIGWRSDGGFDRAGLAPERYVEHRIGRAAQSATFDRGRGRIGYAGREVEHEFPPGAQDRLSWMIQLPAILAAQPPEPAPAAHWTIFVSDARGRAEPWTFEVAGREALELPAGRVGLAWHLRRLPRQAADSGVEVWLDPARQWLPVRVLLASDDGQTSDFRLRSDGAP